MPRATPDANQANCLDPPAAPGLLSDAEVKRFRFERDAEQDHVELDDVGEHEREATVRQVPPGKRSRLSQLGQEGVPIGPRTPPGRFASLVSPGKRALSARLAHAQSVPEQVSLQHRRAGAPGFDEKEELEIAARGVTDSAGPLPYIEEIQRAFGRHDLKDIRAAAGGEAGRANQRMGSLAYAMGEAIVFRDSSPDLFTVAHEAAHVIQQRAGAVPAGTVGASGDRHEAHADAVAERVVRGQSAEDLLDQVAPGDARDSGQPGPASVQRLDEEDYEGLTTVQAILRALLDDEADDALTLMRRLDGASEANVVLNSDKLLATRCFDNGEMDEAAGILVGHGGRLSGALDWMYEEGADDWGAVRSKIARAPAAQRAELVSNGWRDWFVDDVVDDEEMPELVDLLGLRLFDKLCWMDKEGTDWRAVKNKIVAAPPEQRSSLVADDWRDWFIGLADDSEEIALLVDLLGMDLVSKIQWLFAAKAADWIILIKIDAAAPDEKATLVTDPAWRDRFIAKFDGESMYLLVGMLGMDLVGKLEWLFAANVNASILEGAIASAPAAEREPVVTNAWRDKFVETFDDEGMSRLVDLFDMPLSTKLDWMYEEGTDWIAVRSKIMAAPIGERAALVADGWRDWFVDLVDTEAQMSELVDLIGMPLVNKLDWMRSKGSNYGAVIGKIVTAPADQRPAVYDSDLREFFVNNCNDQEMAVVVILLGGTLIQQLSWMAGEGTSAELVLDRVNAAPADQRIAIYDDSAVLEMIREFVPIERIPIVDAAGGTPAQQMDLFGAETHIRLLTWATPSADWVDAIMARESPLDLFEVAKGDPAGWGPFIAPRLWDLLATHKETLYPEERVAVFWAAYGSGSTFTADQILHFFKLVFGREIQPASEDITWMTGLLTRKRFSVVAPTDATAQALMACVKPGGGSPGGIGRAEVATGTIAFCTEEHEEELGITGWTTLESNVLDVSYFADPYVIIRAVGSNPARLGVQPGELDSDPMDIAADGTPEAVGTGLNYFQNHVRHEIGHAVGAKTIGSMSRSGNQFALEYGGWQESSESEFLAVMWSGQSEPATGWPSIFIGATSVIVTDDDVRDWCIAVISSGKQPDNPLGNAPGDFRMKKGALAGSIWVGEKLLWYLLSIPSTTAEEVPGAAYEFPGFTPPSPVPIFSSRWGRRFATYSTEAYNAFRRISWYARSSPVEMFAEMYTARYSGLTMPVATSGGDPDAFFTELEAQRDPMFGAPPRDEPALDAR